MPRYYVVLYTPDTMRVPIKRAAAYGNGAMPFCAGCPQFFGGRIDAAGGGNVDLTLRAEVQQESRTTLEFVSRSAPLPFYAANGQQLRFYLSRQLVGGPDRWHATGVPWQDPPPVGGDTEMDRIVEVHRADFDPAHLDDREYVLQRLGFLCNTLAAPAWAEFLGTATAEAFFRFIRNHWAQP